MKMTVILLARISWLFDGMIAVAYSTTLCQINCNNIPDTAKNGTYSYVKDIGVSQSTDTDH